MSIIQFFFFLNLRAFLCHLQNMELKAKNDHKSLSDFIKQDQIGNGSFSKVYKVLDTTNNTLCAAKI